MHYLARILGTTKVLWPFYVGIIVSSIATAIAALVSPFLIRDATDTIVDAVGAGDPDTISRAATAIIWLGIGLLVADLVQTIVHNIGGYLGDVMTARMREILSTRYFAKLLSLPQRYFDDQVTGTIIARLERSITNVTQFLQSFSNNFFPMLLTVFAVLGITGWHYWPLALLLALVFPTYMWLTALTSKRWQKIEGRKNARIDVAGGRFAEVVGQVKVVRSFTAETREVRDFAAHYDATVDLTREQSTWWHRMDALRGGILNAIFFGIYLLLFLRTLHGDFSIGTMVMLIQLVNMARQPATMMSFLVDAAQRAVAGSRDYFDVMALDSEESAPKELVAAAATDGGTKEGAGTSQSTRAERGATAAGATPARAPKRLAPPEDGSPVISLDDVSFAYEEGNPVLEGVTFHADRGEKVALVGESGSGKSTLVNLILGFYQPTGGTLEVCGADVRDVDTDALRDSVGVVFQDAALFSGTIRENIAYGRPDATDEQIRDAARRANADGFIRRFPDGYDTTIGERGLKLSGGQKQRVAIARAILKDAPVLLLDEATSALDTKAEREVQRGLEQLMEGRTTIIIAHRLSTISNVDTIVTLDRGRVGEVGSPAELAVSGGIYAELLKLTASASAADRRRLKKYGLEV
ncbi:ABC transporter ATP-binding protein [Corynebacterium hansenii]|uniref:ABC transporter ATP-binding protein n=1 Tax=Corynebacterium hansenii TaxID=394964 RepID=A0ABV7ZRX5_9CORY|nr:ABC transporter ATP-binding protein [Corynebacterium hansenii]WJZ00550.1 Putative multidrug export ATP-binding/permease protein [Corynebacterium hansenii]